MSLRTILLLVVLAPTLVVAQTLSPTERRIVSAVDARTAEALALLERTVNINSGTHHFAGVKAVGDVLDAEFRKLGFTTRWVDGTPWRRAGHLVVERHGSRQGPAILLIGHLDTVFERDSPLQRFERVPGDSARGPGIADMKGGNVVMLLALRALREAGVLDHLQITAVFTGDEEDSGRPIALARKDLTDAADWARFALGFENGGGAARGRDRASRLDHLAAPDLGNAFPLVAGLHA